MKKFLITYIIFAVILLIGVYFITLVQESNKRIFEFYFELAQEARETNDLEPFIKYQSIAFRKLEHIENNQYNFYIYQIIAKQQDEYLNQFSIFVLPKVAVNYAPDIKDPYDLTGMIVKDSNNNSIIFDTLNDPTYIGYAVSHGIEQIGFYFYAEPLNESYTLRIELTDYLGQIIFSETIEYEYLDWPLEDDSNITLGFTNAEKEALLNLNATLQPAIQRNLTIYLVIAFAVGAFLYHIIKNVKTNPYKK